MALRSLARSIPVNVVYRPASRVIPVMTFRKSYSAASTKHITETTNKTDAKTAEVSSPESTLSAAESPSVDVEKKDEKKEDTFVEDKEQGYGFGAFHWNMERATAITLIPLISTQFVYGAHPIVDGLLGVVLPYHIYMGFDSCITDYIQKRNFPRLHKAANWANFGTMGLVMWGCFEFNTNDVGMTEFIQRLWTC
ncbi:CybS-domain-containing protein [Backusella circina FSU 941]|nr:CybS-domain-containing protein [Backusella circina FSU 941]